MAADAWHACSFDGVGVAEICRLAKVHKGSFFHFFASKEALLLAVIERHAVELSARLQAGPFRPDVPPLDRLRRFFAELGAAVRDERKRTGAFRGCPIGNLVSELATQDEAVRNAAAGVLDALRTAFLGALREAAADGSLSGDVDVEVTADAILAYMQGLAVLGKAYRDPGRLERVGALLPALFGSAPRTAPTPPARRRALLRKRG